MHPTQQERGKHALGHQSDPGTHTSAIPVHQGSRPGPWLVGAWRVPGPGRAGCGQLVVHRPEFLFGMIKSFWDSSWWVRSSGNGLGATQLPTAR